MPRLVMALVEVDVDTADAKAGGGGGWVTLSALSDRFRMNPRMNRRVVGMQAVKTPMKSSTSDQVAMKRASTGEKSKANVSQPGR